MSGHYRTAKRAGAEAITGGVAPPKSVPEAIETYSVADFVDEGDGAQDSYQSCFVL